MRAGQLAEYEPLLPDQRVEKIVHQIKSEFGFKKLKDAEFVTFIQPAKLVNVEREGISVPTRIDDMAVFAVMSPNPRPYAKKTGQKIMTHATVSLEDFRSSEKEGLHYAGAPDAVHGIYKMVVKEHLSKLDDLKQLIN